MKNLHGKKNIKDSQNKGRGRYILFPLLLFVLGSCIILFGGWNLFKQTYLNKDVIFSKQVKISEKKFQISDKYMERPKLGSAIGKLIISSISLEQPIIHGDDDDELSKGVGHDAGTTLPGEKGNVVLDGHRDTIFGNLGKIKIGDSITIETSYGTFNYKVAKTRIVKSDDRTVIVRTDKEMLTIYTCYPFNYIGAAPQRYVIVADFVDSKLK